jgi:hypothetical protein
VPRLAVLTLLCLTLAACGPARDRADLVFINGAEPESFDPAVVTDQVGMRISTALFEGLCRIDESGTPGPGIAARWEVSPDKKHYTFHLRPNALWSNGDPVTAHDFIRSWQRVLDPTFGADYASQLYVLTNAAAYKAGSPREADIDQLDYLPLHQGNLVGALIRRFQTVIKKTKKGFTGKLVGGEVWYWLLRRVTHKPDPRALPDDGKVSAAVLQTAREHLDRVMTGNG